jgi:succinate-semialdehyde dehydrogenase/glutarate-semialdehyde dehydrogenase
LVSDKRIKGVSLTGSEEAVQVLMEAGKHLKGSTRARVNDVFMEDAEMEKQLSGLL